jgi:two-component system nitrogen regulation response regulator GlnG
MAKGDVILPGDLPALISSGGASAAERTSVPAGASGPAPAEEKPADLTAVSRMLFQWAREQGSLKILPAVERELIIQALLETKGNQVQAAKLLGITRATLRKRVEKFQIKQALAIQ